MSNTHIKDHYDQEVPSLSGGNYQQYRWFGNEVQRVNFTLTKDVITKHLLVVGHFKAQNILEIGPGPGTWTEVLLERFPGAQFTLVDISEQMLKQASERLVSRGNFNFINQDFTNFEVQIPFDLVFSSRAIEYAEDKVAFINNLARCLTLGGTGFVITKTPHYFRDRLLFRHIPLRHQRQLSLRQFKRLVKASGLTVLGAYPVTISVPFFHSAKLNLWMSKILTYLPLNFLTLNFVESYALKFAKQEVVEVFGLPGSGKTTYAKDLESQGYERIKVRTKWELIKYNFIFLFYYPTKFVSGLWYLIIYAGQPRWWYYKLMNLFFQHNAKFIKAQGFARAVIDQGHFQNLLSLFDYEQSAIKLKKYAKHLPQPTELVILTLDKGERQKRLNYRPRLPREELGLDNHNWAIVAEHHFAMVKDLVDKLGFPKYSLK
jgi:trans-aconitate methyltransferase